MEEAVVVSNGRVSDSSSVHKIRSIAGGRKVLLNVVPDVWNDASDLFRSGSASQSLLLRKYLVKLTQRIGLTCLPLLYTILAICGYIYKSF
ncbi:hypothetical protein QYF36_020570 [Acer negundo]|nr:hypothetical protein QYF36_020570 [Acer negundo]